MPPRTVFVSHAHADNAKCDPYVEALHKYDISLYYDRTNPQVGRDILQTLQQELERAQALIVMVTPASLNSFWVEHEIGMFFALMAKDRSRLLIPVKLEPCELTPQLAMHWWVDATNQTMEQVVDQVARALPSTENHSLAPWPTKSSTERGFDTSNPSPLMRAPLRNRHPAPPPVMPPDSASRDPKRAVRTKQPGDIAASVAPPTPSAGTKLGPMSGASSIPGQSQSIPSRSAAHEVAQPDRVAATQPGISRRTLITLCTAGLAASAGLIWWVSERKPPPALPTTQFPERLTSLGFAARTGSGEAYIVPPLCAVVASEFLIGSNPQRDSQAYTDELPQQLVTLPAFQISQFPVTVAEYACFVRAGQTEPANWQAQLNALDHPVVGVSWHNTVAYAIWLASRTQAAWRLPSEAEWEKAARGSDGRIYTWGDTFDQSRCNTVEGGKGGTTAIGIYPSGASPYDARDMAGNVWEWTSSLYLPYPYDANDGRENPNSSGNRTLRGGSWRDVARQARAACRLADGPDFLYDSVGFRLALLPTGL